MTDHHTSASSTAPTAHQELEAILATIGRLIKVSSSVARTLKEVNERLPVLIDRLAPLASDDNVWVRAVAKTPVQVESEHHNQPTGSRPWWVVYIGREPGLYLTSEEADVQVKGCPNQQYRKKTSKEEALLFYSSLYTAGKVEKNVPPCLEEHLLLRIYLLTGEGIMPWETAQSPNARIKCLRLASLGYALQKYAFDHSSGEDLIPLLAPHDTPDSWGVPYGLVAPVELPDAQVPVPFMLYDVACQYSCPGYVFYAD
ncbi:hypothetical protein DFH09DRAFT_1270320 [Mycena vulgaris]|nr:hypothetical protein DFH09DRAFT_1270320 [Mycena vulgaris]